MKGYLTVQAAASKLEIDERHVRRLIADGIITGEKFGKSWLVKESSLKRYKKHPSKGRPKVNADKD